MKPPARLFIAFAATAACILVVSGCGRDPIEETQRQWLADQHVVEKKMAALRRQHQELLRSVRSAEIPSPGVLAELHESDSALAGIESMFDKHSLERQASINAGDVERMRRSHEIAKADYRSAGTDLNRIAVTQARISSIVDSIRTLRNATDSSTKPREPASRRRTTASE